MQAINLGLIGCGGMGSDLARNAQKLERARVIAVADVSAERAKNLGQELEAKPYAEYRELLENPDIEAVLIAVPPFLHRETVEYAVSAGKHVFCEKPMATTVADCDAMIAAVQKAGVKFQIGHVCRFHATHGKVRELVASGEFGVPTTMMVHRLGGRWGSAHPEWRMRRAGCGGILMEVNAHEIDFMRYVCGNVARVSAMGGKFAEPGLDYPDVALVTLQFANGAVGFLHSGHASAIGGYGGRLDCANGSIIFPQMWGGGDAAIETQRFGEERRRILLSDIQVETPVRAEIRAFVNAIMDNTETPITLFDGRAIVEVAEAAYLSIERGGEVISLPLS